MIKVREITPRDIYYRLDMFPYVKILGIHVFTFYQIKRLCPPSHTSRLLLLIISMNVSLTFKIDQYLMLVM